MGKLHNVCLAVMLIALKMLNLLIRLEGYYNGVGSLVPKLQYISEQEAIIRNITANSDLHKPVTTPPIDPVAINPYSELTSEAYLVDHYPAQECFLNANDSIKLPDIFAYPGLPQSMAAPQLGSYDLLGLRDDICWDRFGRLGPYGYGYEPDEGGLGLAEKSEKAGVSKIWKQQPKIDYRNVNWGEAQRRCYEKNKRRFEPEDDRPMSKASETNTIASRSDKPMKRVQRQAYILRAYTGYRWDDHQLLTMRAMITELALKSGGEYDVHLLVQVRDDSIPIWTDKDIYRRTVEENVPEEFWGITTLWSEELMRLYYPGPFPDNFENPSGSPIHGVYRGAHFPLFWFAQQHPEYDFYWNWEMDLRYTGHYYEFNKKVTAWAKEQPRKGLWERNTHYYIPNAHGNWTDFTKTVENQILESSETPVWGPVEFENSGIVPPSPESQPPRAWLEDNYDWGVGEDADYISFNPLFDPSKTNWVFRDDVDGFSTAYPIPPRRVAIITVARLSKKLLDIAHNETYQYRHTMFPEMWPPTIALHHGLKGVFAPHPLFFNRVWPVDYLNQVFNYPETPEESVFGFGEHNQLGSSFYYNAGFSGALWRRWLGYKENQEGGSWFELTNTGRMCLRSMLFHPIKNERGSAE